MHSLNVLMSSLAATLLMDLNETPTPLVPSVLWEILHKNRGKLRPVRSSQPHTLHDCRRADEDGQSRALMSPAAIQADENEVLEEDGQRLE